MVSPIISSITWFVFEGSHSPSADIHKDFRWDGIYQVAVVGERQTVVKLLGSLENRGPESFALLATGKQFVEETKRQSNPENNKTRRQTRATASEHGPKQASVSLDTKGTQTTGDFMRDAVSCKEAKSNKGFEGDSR